MDEKPYYTPNEVAKIIDSYNSCRVLKEQHPGSPALKPGEQSRQGSHGIKETYEKNVPKNVRSHLGIESRLF
ncbi:hypothetical protein KW787_02320 [Candidatus Pacearchaeota archaeon]|nr:hypothetical protein [Candidatus Pacearchaeota archaeon]